MSEEYIPRLVDKIIQDKLDKSPAVCIEGPKWCGKTTTSKKHAKSVLSVISRKDVDDVNAIIELDYRMVLKGDVPRLIDEWQNIPSLWDYVRYESDERNESGQFILTGSSIKEPGSTLHSGAGRIARVRMHALSLYESGESNGIVSLNRLFEGKFENGMSDLTVDSLADAIIRGGWPYAISKHKNNPDIATSFIDNVCESNIVNFDGMKHSPKAVRRLLKSISRNLCMNANFSKIYGEMVGDGRFEINDKTAKKILDRLTQGYVIENLPAWDDHIRSRNQLILGDKWHLCDPSLALAILNVKKEKLFADMQFFGFVFESLCLRDLRVYLDVIGGDVSYYKRKDGFEIDFIIELDDGRWAAVEVKTGSKQEEEAARNLIAFMNDANKANHTPPSFLMILTAGKYAYRRKDGVYVVPIGCLRD